MCELTYMLIFCLFKRFVPLLRHSGLLLSSLRLILQLIYITLSYKLPIQYNLQCPHPNPSHCEGFSNVPFLGAIAHILELSSKRHRLKPFEVSPHGLSDRLRLTCEPSSPINAFSHILGVELGLVALDLISCS